MTSITWERRKQQERAECVSCGKCCAPEVRDMAPMLGWVRDYFGDWTCPDCDKADIK